MQGRHCPDHRGRAGAWQIIRGPRILSDPWFSDELADLGGKDAAMQTQGAWLIEISELGAPAAVTIGDDRKLHHEGAMMRPNARHDSRASVEGNIRCEPDFPRKTRSRPGSCASPATETADRSPETPDRRQSKKFREPK